jgi:hypothetical protein
MTDWVTISQVATAGGTLVLAVATFSSIKSSQRATALAERSLLAGQRPLLVPSRVSDDKERIRFGDGFTTTVPGHGAMVERSANGDNFYLTMSLRNGGAGLAVIQGWSIVVGESGGRQLHADVEDFRPQQRDLYVPAGDTGFWQGAVRGRDDRDHAVLATALDSQTDLVMVDLLYGDHEGGQRTITRFRLYSPGDERPRAEVLRVWVLDGIDPRRQP